MLTHEQAFDRTKSLTIQKTLKHSRKMHAAVNKQIKGRECSFMPYRGICQDTDQNIAGREYPQIQQTQVMFYLSKSFTKADLYNSMPYYQDRTFQSSFSKSEIQADHTQGKENFYEKCIKMNYAYVIQITCALTRDARNIRIQDFRVVKIWILREQGFLIELVKKR